MTPNASNARQELEARFTGLRYSVFNCRHIGSKESNRWSQHAATQPGTNYRSNALDIFAGDPAWPGSPWHELDAVAAWLRKNRRRLGIRQVLWRTAAHWDHIHVDFYPMLYDAPRYRPPCRGGRLIVIYPPGTPGGSQGDRFKRWSWGDPSTPPEEETVTPTSPKATIEDLQQLLNDCGHRDTTEPDNPQPLVKDGAWGARTQSAVDNAYKSIGWEDRVGDEEVTAAAAARIAAVAVESGDLAGTFVVHGGRLRLEPKAPN